MRCAACGQEVPAGAVFCPACGATTGTAAAAAAEAGAPAPGMMARPAAVAPAAAGEAGLLLVGSIGAYTMMGVTLLTIIQLAARVRSEALPIVTAILALGGLIGMGIGFLGYQKATKNGLAQAVAVLLFMLAFLSVLPLLAYAFKSAGIMKIAVYGAPALGILAWASAGFLALSSKDVLGAGLANLVGITLLISAVWDLTSLVVTFGRIVRGRSAAEVLFVLTILFTAVKLAGIGGLATAFQKLRTRPTAAG